MVRLWTSDRRFFGTADIRLERFAPHTLRHGGVLYELIGRDADGVRDYRALEPIPEIVPITATLMDTHGNHCGTVPIPADAVPETVTVDGVTCPLWTSRDQAGRVVYLKPESAEVA